MNDSRRFTRLIRFAFLLSFCALPLSSRAATISGVVKDPSGAVIAGARIEIREGQPSPAATATVQPVRSHSRRLPRSR